MSGFFRLERPEEFAGAVAHLVMARPDKANAMSPDFWEELPAHIAALEADAACRALVISGEGRHFTAGMDLSAFEGITKLTEGEPGRGAYALRALILKLQRSGRLS